MSEAGVQKRAHALLESRKTLMLATVNANHVPTPSYAPFVERDLHFYVYISTLSRHTKDLQAVAEAGVFFVEDESEAENMFARKRVIMHCAADVIERESEEWRGRMAQFREKFGEIFSVIEPLQDFILFRLTPRGEIVYVEGFGRAFRMNERLEQSEHIRGTTRGAKPVKEI